MVHSSSNSCPGNGPDGRRLKPTGRTSKSYLVRACALAFSQQKAMTSLMIRALHIT